MNYEDELERSRARRSRRREGTGRAGNSRASREQAGHWASTAEPGSRASRMQGPSRRRKKPGGKRKIVIGVLAAFFVVIAAVAGGGFWYINHTLNKMDHGDVNRDNITNVNLSQDVRDQMEEGYWTVAVFGLDSRDSSLGKGNQSDVIMIVNLDRKTGEIKLVSVFRDTYLNISDKNTYNKINAAYASGGPEQAIKAINKNLDLNITDYVTFNWKAVATAINILGGIDIDISQAEFYYINSFITETVKGTGIGSVQLKKAGLQHLDGVQAVAYGRLRLMDTDYARTERQRIVINKAFEKAKTADLATLSSLVGNMSEMCRTNINFYEDILPLVSKINKYHMGDSMGFPAARGEESIKVGSRRTACVVPQTLESNVVSLHNFLFGTEAYTPTSTVKNISAKIAEISGLNTAGKEVDHVATDKGYVPKSTAARATTAAPTEASTEETSELSTDDLETSEGESLPEGESESGENGSIHTSEGESTSAHETESVPNGPGYETTRESTTAAPTTEPSRPQSPLDVNPSEATREVGPGVPGSEIPEATTAAPTTEAAAVPTTGSQTSVIVTMPEAEAGGPASQATTAGPGF